MRNMLNIIVDLIHAFIIASIGIIIILLYTYRIMHSEVSDEELLHIVAHANMRKLLSIKFDEKDSEVEEK